MTAPAACCASHRTASPDGVPAILACCDRNDCGPCCPDCPTCPTVRLGRENERLRGLLLELDPWALDEPPLNRPPSHLRATDGTDRKDPA